MRIRTITMPDDDSGELIIPNPDAGYAGEGNATQLVVTVPAAYAQYSKYLEFQPTGAEVPPYGPLGDGLSEFSFLLPSSVTKNGRLKVQLVIKSGDTIVKSAEGMLYVKTSINALEGTAAAENTVIQELVERTAAAEAKASAATDAAEDATAAVDTIPTLLETHNTSDASHQDIRGDISTVEAIARGRALARVFDEYADMTAWLAVPENV